MPLFKSKKSIAPKQSPDSTKIKCQMEKKSDCPMCHISDDIINQLKSPLDAAKK